MPEVERTPAVSKKVSRNNEKYRNRYCAKRKDVWLIRYRHMYMHYH